MGSCREPQWYDYTGFGLFFVIFAAVNIIALPIRLIKYVFSSTVRGCARVFRHFHPHNHD